jgi:hypothetical protein
LSIGIIELIGTIIGIFATNFFFLAVTTGFRNL